MHPNVQSNILDNSQVLESAWCPSEIEWIKKLVHLHNGIPHSTKKEEHLPLVTAWVEEDSIVISEIIQVVNKKYHKISPGSGT